jgi:hypothetical protein
MHVRGSIACLLESRVLLVESLADRELATEHADRATATHPTNNHVPRTIVRTHSARHLTLRRAAELGGPLHALGLMRALLLVLLSRLVNPLVPHLHRSPRRTRGFLLQRSVHALMNPVLLRMTWLDELGVDTELDPPHQRIRETGQCVGCERGSVVGSDSLRQATLLQ